MAPTAPPLCLSPGGSESQAGSGPEASSSTPAQDRMLAEQAKALKKLKPRYPCQNCSKELDAVDQHRCSACNQSVYCSRECQVAAWKIHKPQCRSVAERKGRKEAFAVTDPGLLGFQAARDAFVQTINPLVVDATYSALHLSTPSSLHLTHALFVHLLFLPTESDPSTNFSIKDVLPLKHADLEARLRAGGALSDATPLAAQLSQHGLNTVHGMGNAPKDRIRTMAVYLAEDVRDGTTAIQCVPMCLEKHVEATTSAVIWGLRNDGEWEKSLRAKAKLSAVKIAKGSRPEMTERNWAFMQAARKTMLGGGRRS